MSEKFTVPDDPFVQERRIRKYIPPKEWMRTKKEEYYTNKINQSRGIERDEWMRCKVRWLNDNADEIITKGFEDEVARCMEGRSKYNTKTKCTWGEKPLPFWQTAVLAPKVKKKMMYDLKINELSSRMPRNLDEAYLFIKYILMSKTPGTDFEEEYRAVYDDSIDKGPKGEVRSNRWYDPDHPPRDPITGRPYNLIKPAAIGDFDQGPYPDLNTRQYQHDPRVNEGRVEEFDPGTNKVKPRDKPPDDEDVQPFTYVISELRGIYSVLQEIRDIQARLGSSGGKAGSGSSRAPSPEPSHESGSESESESESGSESDSDDDDPPKGGSQQQQGGGDKDGQQQGGGDKDGQQQQGDGDKEGQQQQGGGDKDGQQGGDKDDLPISVADEEYMKEIVPYLKNKSKLDRGAKEKVLEAIDKLGEVNTFEQLQLYIIETVNEYLTSKTDQNMENVHKALEGLLWFLYHIKDSKEFGPGARYILSTLRTSLAFRLINGLQPRNLPNVKAYLIKEVSDLLSIEQFLEGSVTKEGKIQFLSPKPIVLSDVEQAHKTLSSMRFEVDFLSSAKEKIKSTLKRKLDLAKK